MLCYGMFDEIHFLDASASILHGYSTRTVHVCPLGCIVAKARAAVGVDDPGNVQGTSISLSGLILLFSQPDAMCSCSAMFDIIIF